MARVACCSFAIPTRRGWHFPGGGVEFNETVYAALGASSWRKRASAGRSGRSFSASTPTPSSFPGDHVLAFVVRAWEHNPPLAPNREIAEAAFFATNALPDGATAGTRRRIAELAGQAPVQAMW